MEKINKSVTIKNSIWKLIESFGSKGISMVVSIILARLLLPEDYGIIALTTVFTSLTDILIQGGFSTALISKEEIYEDDYSTVLTTSIILALILYILIFIFAPVISEIYGTPILCIVLRVISLSLFCQAFSAVRTAIVSREMKFKVLLICSIASNIVSGAVGILCAYLDFGVWALVIQQLLQQFLLTAILYFTVKIKVRFIISKRSLKEIMPFSIKILLSSLLSFAGDSLYTLAIGRVYSVKDLAYYEKGGQFPRQLSLYTFSAVSNVFLPVFSSYAKDREKLREVFIRTLNVICYVIFPMMAGMCMTGELLIRLLLTDKWLDCIEILRWNCLYYAATPIMLINVQLHFAIGKGETRIKTEIIRIVLMIICFVSLVLTGVDIIIITAVLAAIQVIIMAVIMYMTSREINFNLFVCVKNILPTILSVIIMCAGVYAVSFINTGMVLINFIFQVIVGVLTYWICSIFMHNKAYIELIDILNGFIKRKVKKKHERI